MLRPLIIPILFMLTDGLIAQPTQRLPLPQEAAINLPSQPIGPSELLNVVVYNQPSLSRTVRVSVDGMVRLPMLKQQLKVAGMLPAGLELAIAQAVIYLATAPKSNAAYSAFGAAKAAAEATGSLNPPMHILNAPTRLMKDLGYGKGYAYDPDTPEGFSGQNYFPDGMARKQFYQPTAYGFEKEVKARLERWAALRAKVTKGG